MLITIAWNISNLLYRPPSAVK